MATGFAKWGMTGGTAAALLLADLVLGRANPWAALFDPNRLNAARLRRRRSSRRTPRSRAHFVGDRLTQARPPRRSRPRARARAPSCATAARRSPPTATTTARCIAVSPRCTHLGCQVDWNDAERSWDCPCHGSRFAPDGSVLEGPAVHRLEVKPT